jgi:hypothetical protein
MAFAPQRPVYLKHPHFVGLCGDGSNVNDASGQLDQERHVVADQPTKRPDFDGEEVGPPTMLRQWARKNINHDACLHGAGSMPWRLSTLAMVPHPTSFRYHGVQERKSEPA